MSPWDGSRWFTATPKQAPPEHGIKVKQAGTTWWGQRWIEALQRLLRGDEGRLARGRSYARAGRTHDLVVQGGAVSALVTGSRLEPYRVTLELSRLSDAEWSQAIHAMAEKAQFSAELLAGEMPREIDTVFHGGLFPQRRAELVTACSCPDHGDPCKHIAATHYVLGEALDRDPFLLFELRGRSKAQVLDELRTARSADAATAAETTPGRKRPSKKAKLRNDPMPSATTATEIPSVELRDLPASDYDRAPEALPTLQFCFEAPLNSGAVLRQLGLPAAWDASASPVEALSPLVRRAAEAARRIALTEPPSPTTEPEARQTEPAATARAKKSSTLRKSRNT